MKTRRLSAFTAAVGLTGASFLRSAAVSVIRSNEPNGGHVALGLFFPTIGLILYLLLKGKTPKKAKAIGKGALISAVVIAVFALLAGIINGVALAAVR